MNMFCKIVFVFSLAWSATCLGCESSVTGRLDIQTIEAKVFPYPHVLRVWLPPDYENPANRSKTYPVLYLLDGQNLFDRCTSYIGIEWRVDETVTRLIREGKIPPVIVVGLDNAGERRAEEYLPWDDPFNPGANEPKGRLFPRYLRQDVMPYVKAHYRVAEGTDNTAIGGSSYGGIAALNIALNDPLLASKILIESPSLHVGNGALLRETENLVQVSTRIYIGMGDQEAGKEEINHQILSGVHLLAQHLVSSSIAPVVQVNVGTGEHHNESAWSRRLPEALIFLYGTAQGNVEPRSVPQR